MPNRIQAAIDRMRARLAALPEAERRRLEETLKASWEELVAYQRWWARSWRRSSPRCASAPSSRALPLLTSANLPLIIITECLNT